ncbi:MAG: glycerol-3-phosphate acyltransferase [Patescibacteria group bacterium]
MNTFIILLGVGYLIGSLSPGYFFGRIVKSIDVRKFGNKNTGAANTYRLVGPVYGIITGVFDALKATLAYWIAVNQINPDLAILVGLAAVVGHIWPFYLKFRGGRGAASLAGLSAIALYYTQSWYALIFITGAITYGMIFNQVPFQAPVRKILKLGGLIFPLGLFWFTKSGVTNVVAWLFAILLIFDFIRLLVPRLNLKYLELGFLAKRKETKFLSGYTLFLAGTLVVLKYFSSEIAIFIMSAFIVSDVLAPAGKQAFLPIRFIKEKTIGGAIVVFTGAVLAGIFLNSLSPLSLPLKLILSGAAIMAILDQFSFLVDDNLLVPISTAVILTLVV